MSIKFLESFCEMAVSQEISWNPLRNGCTPRNFLESFAKWLYPKKFPGIFLPVSQEISWSLFAKEKFPGNARKFPGLKRLGILFKKFPGIAIWHHVPKIFDSPFTYVDKGAWSICRIRLYLCFCINNLGICHLTNCFRSVKYIWI